MSAAERRGKNVSRTLTVETIDDADKAGPPQRVVIGSVRDYPLTAAPSLPGIGLRVSTSGQRQRSPNAGRTGQPLSSTRHAALTHS